MKKTIVIIFMMIIMILMLTGCQLVKPQKEGFQIVTSFSPIYILTKNIAKGIDQTSVINMASQNVGCLHDYTLQTSDLMKVESADVFVVNGLGIENFIQKILDTYPSMPIIEAGKGVDCTIEGEENAHIWLDIEKYEQQLRNITEMLVQYDKEHALFYQNNAMQYQLKLEQLKKDLKEQCLIQKKCVSFSESLAFLANSFNLQILTIETEHEQNGLSAERLMNIVEYIKTNKIKNIILDGQTARNNAETVALETGANIYVLHSGLEGAEDDDAYLAMMRQNAQIVKNMEE